jgi:hypothetical protein
MRQRQLLTPLGVTDSQWQHLVVALIVASGLTMAIGIWWSMRGTQRRARDPLLRAWRRYTARLAKAGVARGSDEGPIQFSQRAARTLPHRAGNILRLGNEFARLRYDPAGAGDADAQESLIRALRRFRVRA